jgi:hypothetical protein
MRACRDDEPRDGFMALAAGRLFQPRRLSGLIVDARPGGSGRAGGCGHTAEAEDECGGVGAYAEKHKTKRRARDERDQWPALQLISRGLRGARSRLRWGGMLLAQID